MNEPPAIFNPVVYRIIQHFLEGRESTTKKDYYANTTTIAKGVGVSYVTIAKYLVPLERDGILYRYTFGSNHIYQLADTPVTDAVVSLLNAITEWNAVNKSQIEIMQT